jgi:TetR/AcrR family transcriptional regulator, mexJK operon transcriptional repressor
MPRRSEDNYEERRQQIIDGALHVFASKGFEQATNREIAAAAGIGSAGLIYHYFKDKSDLLRQVVEQRMPLLQLLSRPEELMALPPREALARFGGAYLKVMENAASVALMRLIMGEAIRRPQVARIVNEIGPSRALRFLADYLQQQMEAGALRRVDAALAARCFMGPLILFFLTREVLQQPEALSMDAESVLATNLDVFLRGMEP